MFDVDGRRAQNTAVGAQILRRPETVGMGVDQCDASVWLVHPQTSDHLRKQRGLSSARRPESDDDARRAQQLVRLRIDKTLGEEPSKLLVGVFLLIGP